MKLNEAKRILKNAGYIVEAEENTLVKAAGILKSKLTDLFASFKGVNGTIDYCYDVPIRWVGEHPKVRTSLILKNIYTYDDSLEKYIDKTERLTWEIEFTQAKKNDEVNLDQRVRVLFGNAGSMNSLNFEDAVKIIVDKLSYIEKNTLSNREWDEKHGSGLGASAIAKSWYSGPN